MLSIFSCNTGFRATRPGSVTDQGFQHFWASVFSPLKHKNQCLFVSLTQQAHGLTLRPDGVGTGVAVLWHAYRFSLSTCAPHRVPSPEPHQLHRDVGPLLTWALICTHSWPLPSSQTPSLLAAVTPPHPQQARDRSVPTGAEGGVQEDILRKNKMEHIHVLIWQRL